MTEHSEEKPYHLEQPVAAGRDEVWDALTQPPVIGQWFGWDYPGLDAEIQQIFVDEATLTAPERMGWADGSYLEVTGDDDRSTVRAVRTGDPAADPDTYDGIEEGWRVFLAQLRFLLEARPAGVRRTLYLTGATTGRQALEVAGGEAVRLGSRTAQVTVNGHLVVVAGEEHLDSPAAGPVQIVISTFGLDDRDFDAEHQRWAKLWAPVARDAEVTIGAVG